ncbi:protein-tyrosine-phosphatase [Echinicola sediminis]
MKTNLLYPALQQTVEGLDFNTISADRKAELKGLITYIRENQDKNGLVKLNFICTHNSRRSQMSQIWAQTAASYYGLNAQCFSGGTEVTAFNERAVQAMKKAGFEIKKEGQNNPKYIVSFSKQAPPVLAFSKLYNDPSSPSADFATVMTCSHADENCPYIPGAEKRIPVRYEDPKAFDDSPLESQKYHERSMQIACEMFYVFSQIK